MNCKIGLFFLVSVFIYLQPAQSNAQTVPQCDVTMTPAELAAYTARVVRLRNSSPQPFSVMNASIPVYFWINRSNTITVPTTNELIAILQQTNSYFHFANNAHFEFCGLSYISDSRYYITDASERNPIVSDYHKSNVINVYMVDSLWGPSGHALGITTTPNVPAVYAVGNGFGSYTLGHELGHIFGLQHTFTNLKYDPPYRHERVIRVAVDGKLPPNWDMAGDRMKDTPADLEECIRPCDQPECRVFDDNNILYTPADDNGDVRVPDRTNLMSYYAGCANHFVGEQQRYMDDLLANTLNYLINASCTGNAAGLGLLQRTENCNISIKNAEIEITDATNNLICTPKPISNQDAYFTTCNLPKNSTVNIRPISPSNPLNGVTTFDVALISQHVLGVQALTDPYLRLAADVNNSGEVDALDMLQLRQLILRITSAFPNNVNPWRFVPRYFLQQTSFSSQFDQNPLSATYQNYSYNGTNSYMDKLKLDLSTMDAGFLWAWTFRPLKVGDINCSATQASMMAAPVIGTPYEASPSLLVAKVASNRYKLRATPNTALRNSNEKTIVLKAKTAARVAAFQLGFRSLSTKLTFQNIKKGDFNAPNDVFDFDKKDKGELRALWFNTRGDEKDIAIGTILLTAKVKANDNIDNLLDALNIDDNVLQNEFYDKKGNLIAMDLEWDQEDTNNGNGNNTIAANNLTVNTFPNPFTNELTFEITSPSSDMATITVSNIVTGQSIMVQQQLVNGLNTVRIANTATLPIGMLSYTISASNRIANGTITKTR